MMFGRAFVLAALVSFAASLKVSTDPSPTLRDPTAVLSDPTNTSFRMAIHWSEVRLGPPMLVSEACSVGWSNESTFSEWQENDPKAFPEAGIGARRRMYPMEGLEYQLYLPLKWTKDSYYPMPVVIYLHSHGERRWSLMNSESLPRMLARNQSTSFDNRSCWCLDMALSGAPAAAEDLTSDTIAFIPNTSVDGGFALADCTFADTFPAIVIMPQGWTKKETPGWTTEHFEKITNITKAIMEKFNGDADNVIVTGTGEGGEGALMYASTVGAGLISAVAITDSPGTTYSTGLDGVPVWVTGDTAAGLAGNDDLVLSLKSRPSGVTRYTRYLATPKAADPNFTGSYGHSSDLIYRDPAFWQWAWHQKIADGRAKWGMPETEWIKL